MNQSAENRDVEKADIRHNSYFRIGLGLSLVMTQGRSGYVLYERLAARDGISQDTFSLGFRLEF